ncbi:MAG TPA: ankyrin repeat domain-containing protein [Vicinamibacterales bacterium]|nr:ankyrin repeat domain-containing protein [Vicinamibacterales bacterium]
MRLHHIALGVVLLCGTVTRAAGQFPGDVRDADADRARGAITRSLPLLQRSAQTWIEKQTCSSCHHQALGTLAVVTARQRGFRIDSDLLSAQIAHITPIKRESAMQFDAGINPQIGYPYILVALAAAGTPPRREITDARVHYLAGRQAIDGRWRSESHRPPLEDSDFTATALSLRALQLYTPRGRADEFRRRVERARRWLEHALPRTNEDRTMQLLGLAWAGSDGSRVRTIAGALLADQRPDGGWAQIPGSASDAYATGKTLVLLQQVGTLHVGDPAFRRAITFLLDTQQADGSWRQATRRKGPGLPYFETGFPHAEDQFISYAGSAWATIALSLAGDGRPIPLMRPAVVNAGGADVTGLPVDDGVTPLMDAALSGRLADVRRILDSGADVNAHSGGGVTPLMCAVHDPRISALLIARGADVRARTETGVTALNIAAAYDGARDTVKLLLDRGADVNAATKSGKTPLIAASAGGDVAKVRLLLDRGARLDARIEPIGVTALHYAAFVGDENMVRLLLQRGADVNARVPGFGNTTALMESSFAGFDEVTRVLVAGGASLNLQDEEGRTALMYSVWRDPGYSDVVELLLKAGADTGLATSTGLTALGLANQYGYVRFAGLLRAAGAR